MVGQLDGWAAGWLDCWMTGQLDGWVVEWVGSWIVGWVAGLSRGSDFFLCRIKEGAFVMMARLFGQRPRRGR